MTIGSSVKALCLCSLLLLGGCLAVGTRPDHAQPVPEQDQYSLQSGKAISGTGCEFSYRLYAPVTPTTGTHVIFGHGFLRDQNKLIGAGRALANAGIPTATLDFCNMRPWNGNHLKNAADMQQLVELIGAQDDVIYAGFSAGALAALLAADEKTRAVLTLDLVDQGALGLSAAQQLPVPLIGLHGPAHRCNADNNGLSVYEAALEAAPEKQRQSHLIANASHCEFESPSNWLCETACGDSDPQTTNNNTRQHILDRSVELLRPYLSILPNRESNP